MAYAEPSEIKTVAMIGVGTVGASWAALMLSRGLAVRAFDPGPMAETRARNLISSAWPSLVQLGTAQQATVPSERLSFVSSIEEAVSSADLVQENTPETPGPKREILRAIDAAAPPSLILLSSTGGIPPSDLQQSCALPERLVVFHPFNPTHLVPLVEVVPGKMTSPEVTDWAMRFAYFLGKYPIRLRAEIAGHMTNRLQFALVREATRCMLEGIASARDIDAAVKYGLAPRWMLMGGLQTLHLAGGYGGMKGILDHAAEAIESWWDPGKKLQVTEDVKEALVQAGLELSEEMAISDWMEWRDSQLVPLLRVQAEAARTQPGRRVAKGGQ